jgi:ABC-type molybdenum transport system ATPase subunit/photorepair protein PhrA
MLELIEAIAQSGETTVGLTTHRDSEIIPYIRQILTFAHGHLISVGAPAPSPPSGEVKREIVTATPAGETLIRLQNVAVFLDGTPILHGLNWQLKRGHHFAIEGGNGAGKTTFLRLLRGELWPARGGLVERFGSDKPQPRAVVGRQISLLSPALQARYSDEISVETAVASGWFDSFGLLGEMSEDMQQQTRDTIAFCGLTELALRNFARLSYGQRRRVLLARALVTNPQILLLDEALDGLDSASRSEWLGLLAEVAARGASLVVTSHHEGDYPPLLTHSLRLDKGKIVQQNEFSP